MTRRTYIEALLRQIYGDQPRDDSAISINLVNVWLTGGIAAAVKANYKEAIALEGISYINNGFYSTFTGLTITVDTSDNFLYSLTLPSVPYALGMTDGVSSLQFKKDGQVSDSAIFLSQNQWAYRNNIRRIPNKIICCPEGDLIKIQSVLPLWSYEGIVTMVSTGISTDLDSVLHLPDDYFPVITDFVRQQLGLQRAAPQDVSDDGMDNK